MKGIKLFKNLSTSAFEIVIKINYHKLPDAPKISNSIENWDIPDISVDSLNTAGCLIPDEKYLHAAPGFHLTFQKLSVNFPDKYNRKTDLRCCPPCLADVENFSL